jgi:hypothetical protein
VVDDGRSCEEFQYAVKLISGDTVKGGVNIVTPGRFYTAVNIHNPSTCKTVTFRWKVAVANSVDAQDGQITRFQRKSLRPDQSVEIDCPDIARVLAIELDHFVKGFVVIESPCELDVVAVYTAGGSANQPPGQASPVAFHTERVPARRIEACRDDLTLDISTGVAAWMVTKVPATVVLSQPPPRRADVVEFGGATIGPARWISIHGAWNQAGQLWFSGDYTFQYCFMLCSGFEDASLSLDMAVDDTANVWINSKHIGSVPLTTVPAPQFNSIADQAKISQSFLPGLNCITVVVTNASGTPSPGNKVGFLLRGMLKAKKGLCPGCGCCSDGDPALAYPATPAPLP